MAIVTSVETTETRTIIKFHKKGDINQTKIFFIRDTEEACFIQDKIFIPGSNCSRKEDNCQQLRKSKASSVM